MQIEDSNSLAQSGYAQKNEDVDALTVLIEERTAWSKCEAQVVIVVIVYFFYALEYRNVLTPILAFPYILEMVYK